MRVLIFILLAAVAYGETLVIDNPGSAGLDNFTSDNIVDMRSARQMINCDIENGDIVKRIGYYVAGGVELDTLCNGITSFYDFENNARLIKVISEADTGILKYTNSNSLTFASDTAPIRMYGYKNPPFGYDWVQYENAIIGANGKNHPFLYMKDQWGTLSIPTPGAPMVSLLNVAGNQSGTYTYKMHYIADTGVGAPIKYDTVLKSNPAPETQLIFSQNKAVILFGFPKNPQGFADRLMLITRTKANGAVYYVVDTISVPHATDTFYIDTKSDASLGDAIFLSDSTGNNCCEDSIWIPGQPDTSKTGTFLTEVLVDDSFYMAYSHLDTNFGISSEIGPWLRRYAGDNDHTTYSVLLPEPGFLGNNFIDGIVVWWASESDTGRIRVFDTVYTDDSVFKWSEIGQTHETPFDPQLDPRDSAMFYSRPFMKRPLTNKIPYDYMDFSFSRLWGAGDDDFPSRLYFSGRSDTGIIGGSGLGEWDFAFDYLGLAENDGDRITGLKANEEGLLAFKGYSSWFITGFDPDYDMQIQKLSGTIGAVSNNAIASYDREVYFLSPLKRVYRLSGFTDISFKIKSSLQDLSLDTLGQANMIVHEGELWMRLNDTMFICDLKTGRFEWRKYELKGEKYFTFYDSTSSMDYPRDQKLIFSKVGTDSLFGYPRTDGNMEDGELESETPDSPYAVLYKSAPFLIGANTKIIQGTIDAEFGDSIFIRLLSLNDDTLVSVTLYDGDQISGDNFEFALNGGFSNGYHIVITESGKTDTNLTSFRIKRITLDYIRYKVR